MRRLAPTAAKVAVSAGLIAWLLHKAGLASLGSVLHDASATWLIAALLLGFAATCVQTTQWRFLLADLGLRRSWLRCLRLVFIGNVFNSILPSSIGGDVARAAMAAEAPPQRVAAATAVVLQRLCNFPGMLLLMGIGLILTVGDADVTRARPVVIAAMLLGAAGLTVCMTPLFGWIARSRALGRGRPARAIAKLLAALDAFRDRRRQLLAASVRGTVFWSLSILNQWAFMHALGVDISIGYAAVVVTCVNALTMLPVSINGYGVREGGFTAFLVVGTLATRSQAIAVGFCLAAQSLLWAAIGVLCWLSLPNHRARDVGSVALDGAA